MSDLFHKAASSLRHSNILLDVGAGIRPQAIATADRIICVEPFAPYADKLEDMGLQVIRNTANEALEPITHVDTIIALDVIEHMTEIDGKRFIRLCKEKADQVVIFTPLGFMPQEGDAWGMGGDEWQKHRSGWIPEDFNGWTIFKDEHFHDGRGGAFFAIWQRPEAVAA